MVGLFGLKYRGTLVPSIIVLCILSTALGSLGPKAEAPSLESHGLALQVGAEASTSQVAASSMSPAGPSVPGTLAASKAYTVVSRSYSEASFVDYLASNETTALLVNYLPNGSNELVLFNAAKNSSKVIEAVVPGGDLTALISITSAGGEFFLAWQNVSTQQEFYQKVTLAGKITNVSLPLPRIASFLYNFVYANGTSIFASSGRFLFEVNAVSLKLEANYTGILPTNLSVSSVLPVGDRLYIAGGESLQTNTSTAYFGYLNLSLHTLTEVSKAVKHLPAHLYADFDSLVADGSRIYVGGYILVDTWPLFIEDVGGLFYRFTPSTSSFTNQSSLLPVKSWGVYALDPWAKTIALSLNGYELNVTTGSLSLSGGIYTLASSGKSLVNQTSLFPADFLVYLMGETSASNGWFFGGGYNSVTGVAQVVAVRT